MRLPLARTDVWWLAAAVALALLLRIVWVLYATADPLDGRFNDSVFYHLVAAHLAEGGGYTNPFTFLPTAQFAPGYPFFLTGLYWLFGPHLTVAEVANAALGAATVGVVYLLALRLFDSISARIAAVLLAVFPGQILFASVVYSEILFTFLFVLGLLLALLAREQSPDGRWRWLIAFGLIVGAASLVRGAGLALLIIGPAYWALTRLDWRGTVQWSALAIVGAGLLIAPWTVRNLITMDAPLLISSSAGINFWQGHHEGASGGDDGSVEPLLERYGPFTAPGAEVAMSNGGYREGLRFAVANPGEELVLIGKKFRALYLDGDSIALDINEWSGQRPFIAPGLRSALARLSSMFYYAVFFVAMFAPLRWAMQRGQGPLLPLIAFTILTLGHVVLFFGSPRYHFPMIPLFCLLAGWALAALPLFRARLAVRSPRRG
ncbi:MAG: glycosyltransferase family 39 protein [Chloroflexi bacterium]|nr:glycosyltransferase family 39 protein [Chloroflexota bacterium]